MVVHMPYSARIVHKTAGRLRLQMDDEQESPQALQEAMVHLQSLSMSQRVRGNPLTRTIVLEDENDDELEAVIEKAREGGILHLRSPDELTRDDSVAARVQTG